MPLYVFMTWTLCLYKFRLYWCICIIYGINPILAYVFSFFSHICHLGFFPLHIFFRLNFRTEFIGYSFLLLLNPFLVTSVQVVAISHFVLAVSTKEWKVCCILFFFVILQHLHTVKPVLNGISRDQNIFPLKPGFRLIKVHYI
jgi:hypothetical protein